MNSEVLLRSFHPIQKIYQVIATPIQSTSPSIYRFLTIQAFNAKHPQLLTASLNKPQNE
jgi:hypothetical protein